MFPGVQSFEVSGRRSNHDRSPGCGALLIAAFVSDAGSTTASASAWVTSRDAAGDEGSSCGAGMTGSPIRAWKILIRRSRSSRPLITPFVGSSRNGTPLALAHARTVRSRRKVWSGPVSSWATMEAIPGPAWSRPKIETASPEHATSLLPTLPRLAASEPRPSSTACLWNSDQSGASVTTGSRMYSGTRAA